MPAISFLYLFLLFSASFEKEEGQLQYELDDGVIVLTDKNFDKFLEQNPTALIEFYAPWCGHCKTLAPEYSKAASLVGIPLAKVDATVETEVAQRFSVKGYPTIKFWKDGAEPIDYDGGRDADGIVQWVSQKTDPNYKPPPEAVVTLTQENFDELTATHPLVLVEFYAPWCGHCKNLAPEYEKAAQRIKAQGKNILLAKVDATVEKSLGEKFGVSGYPTLKILRNGRRFDYNGPREAKGIVDYMTEQMLPAAKKYKTIKEAKRSFLKDDVTIIGFFASDDSTFFEAFSDAAEMTREEFRSIGYTTQPDVMKHFGAKVNDILIFYPDHFHSQYEPKHAAYGKGSGTTEDLLSFFRENAAPLVGQMTRANAANRYNKFPLVFEYFLPESFFQVVVYYNVDFSPQYREGTEYWRKKVLKIANEHKKSKYRFAIADEEEFAKELADIGLGDSGLEHNVIVFGFDGKKYPMDPAVFDDDLEENLPAFMKQINAGKAKAHVKSAPVPKEDKGPVKTVVGSNFDRVVLDESKDVLIEFYAPWCGHCKSFEPKYNQLATKLKTEQPNLVLAKMDATANDAPEHFPVEGFPTIYFAPAGKKSEPIKYSGNRDIDHLTNFMREHGVRSFEKKTEL